MDMIIEWFDANKLILIDYAIKLVVALAIFIFGKMVARLISKGITKLLGHKGVDPTVNSFIGSLIYGLAMTFVIIAAISHLGFNTTSLVAVIGAAGLAIGLALQGSLSNFASGVLLISFRPFKAGDFVEVAGVAGVVEQVLIFSTTLKTGDNKTVIIPNNSITGGTIINYSTKPTRRIDLVIGVSYDTNLAQAKKVLAEVVAKDERILAEPAVTIGVSALADSSINIVVRPWVKSADYWPVHFDLLENIKAEFDKVGIEIPFPQLSVHVNKED